MKRIVDYTNRVTPKFDAVEDVKEWFGKDKWNEISPQMAQIKDPQQFAFLSGLGGVHDFAVEAWYDLYWGEGSYRREWAKVTASEAEEREKPVIDPVLWPAGNNTEGD